MERTYKWEIGQKVKTYDPDDEETVYGEVTDTTSTSVFIKWEDLNEPTEHFQDEWVQIKLSNRTW